MAILMSIGILLLISFFLALMSAGHELSIPEDVKKVKIGKRKKKLWGVILFLKKKIVHYTSSSG